MSTVDPVRVLLVDDDAGVRRLLRTEFDLDPRFEVVAEGGSGEEAVELAESCDPDLVILDREMPGVGGVEALPEIRRRAPHTAVVVYTSEVDEKKRQAALSAGALEIYDKTEDGVFVDRLVDALVHDGAEDDDGAMEVRVGPVSSDAARLWVENTTAILEAVVAHPDVVGAALPDDVVVIFRSFLEQWRRMAMHGGVFHWAARANPGEVRRVVEHWAAIDGLTDEQLEVLGVSWSPPAARPFYLALTAGVLEALRRNDETRRLAARLTEQWSE